MSDVDLEAIHDAERTLYRAKLRHLEQVALAALAGQPGLALTPLWPPSRVIQIVALDGVQRCTSPQRTTKRRSEVIQPKWLATTAVRDYYFRHGRLQRPGFGGAGGFS